MTTAKVANPSIEYEIADRISTGSFLPPSGRQSVQASRNIMIRSMMLTRTSCMVIFLWTIANQKYNTKVSNGGPIVHQVDTRNCLSSQTARYSRLRHATT